MQGGDWSLPSPVPFQLGKGGVKDEPQASPENPFAYGSAGALSPAAVAALAQELLATQELLSTQRAPAPAPAAQELREDPLGAAIREALEPLASMDGELSLDEMCIKVRKYMSKAVNKFWYDERLSNHGSPPQAHAFVVEFVDKVMGAISNACYDKAWFPEANFAGPIYEAVMSIAKGKKLFARAMCPCIMQYIEEGIFRFREEERIEKAFSEAISGTSLSEIHHKRAKSQLQSAFDDAHTTAFYGVSIAEDPTTQLLKDFILGWMRSFVSRSHQLLEQVSPEKDQQMIFVMTLFQLVVGPELRCLPVELMNELSKPDATGSLPEAGWSFVVEATEAIFAEMEQEIRAKPTKILRTGQASGFTLPNGMQRTGQVSGLTLPNGMQFYVKPLQYPS